MDDPANHPDDEDDDDGFPAGVENAKEMLDMDETVAFGLTVITEDEQAASISGCGDDFPTRLMEGGDELSVLDVELFLHGFRIAESRRALNDSGVPINPGQLLDAIVTSVSSFERQMSRVEGSGNRPVYDIRPDVIREKDEHEAAEDDMNDPVSIEIDGTGDDSEDEDEDDGEGAADAPESGQ